MLKDIINNVIYLKLEEIENYSFPTDSVFGLEVVENGVKYDFIINFSSTNKNLIAFGAGAWPRNKLDSNGKLIEPPFLDRWSWYGYFNESCIAYADPTFFEDENISLGWYVGGKEWYLLVISKIIKMLCKNQNIMHEDMLFFGSSGGGFSSIGLATLIKGSKAIVNNSSFSVKDITDGHYANLINFLKKQFDETNDNKILNQIQHRLSLVDLFEKMEYIPEISYLVNTNSERDMKERCEPFVNNLVYSSLLENNLNVYYYSDDNDNWGGRGPLNTNATVKFIRNYARTHLYSYEEDEI